MKIVFLGNMNNLPFHFAKGIKERGYDVTFIVDAPRNFPLDRPESLEKDIFKKNYPSWIQEKIISEKFKFFKFCFPTHYFSDTIAYLNSFDVIFLNGHWISLGSFIDNKKIVIDIFAGFDLDQLANPNKLKIFVDTFKNGSFYKKLVPLSIARILFKKLISFQRYGIKRADVINYYLTGINPEGDQLLKDIKSGQQYKRLELRGFDCSKFPYKENTERDKFVILNITRFFYLTERNDNKRNDVMIKGIGKFIKKNNPSPQILEIVFFDKGVDIEAAKQLCILHGLTPYIKWHKEVPLHALNKYLEYCDVAFDQMGEQWLGAGLFSMLTGRPLIANGRPDIFERHTGEKSPICQATTEDEVEIWLTKLYNNRLLIKQTGIASRDFVLRHYDINKTIDFFIDCIEKHEKQYQMSS